MAKVFYTFVKYVFQMCWVRFLPNEREQMDGKDTVKYHRIFFRVSRRVFDATAAKIEIRKKILSKKVYFFFFSFSKLETKMKKGRVSTFFISITPIVAKEGRTELGAVARDC